MPYAHAHVLYSFLDRENLLLVPSVRVGRSVKGGVSPTVSSGCWDLHL